MLSAAQERALYRAVGFRVQQLRQDHLTQEELADLVGLSRASIANLEAGRQRVPLHQLFNIAEALHVALSDLLPDRVSLGLDADDAAGPPSITVVSDRRELSPSERQVIARVLRSQSETRHDPS